MNDNLKEKLRKLVADMPANYGQCCASRGYEALRGEIMEAVPLLSSNTYDFKTRVFWILNDIADFPKCCVCGAPVTRNVRTLRTGYNREKAWEEGDALNVACDDPRCVREKSARDGARTCLEKYGVENVFQAGWCKDRITETCMRRSGCARSGNSEEGREKARRTWLEKYGVDHPMKSEEVLGKARSTCLSAYGETSYARTEQYRVARTERAVSAAVERLKEDPEIECADLSELSSVSSAAQLWDTPVTCRCRKCGTEFRSRLGLNNYYKYGTASSCPKCHPASASSKAENDLFEFIAGCSGGVDAVRNTRRLISPFEIDMYLPSKNLAFEFDGLFWHSTRSGIGRDYHAGKTDMCEKIGVRLVHVFENEWTSKRRIVESRIASMFGKYEQVVYARGCAVRDVDAKTAREFQDQNHLQGAVNASVRLGLYHKDELVALMTFGKCRFDKKHQWEMLRFCCRCGCHVPGGAGKLLKYFERNWKPESLVSYADRRWSQGNLYRALGFRLDHVSAPDYWYWNYRRPGLGLESRLKYQKHKLKRVLEKFDPTKSEVENMKDNDFYQVFDCGNYVFEKKFLRR